MRKWLAVLSFMLVVSLLVPIQQHVKADTIFTDVGSTHRAKDEIYYLVKGGITSGVSATKFAPDNEVTREQAAAFLGRALGINGERTNTKFPDVNANSFASGYIEELSNRGIINGNRNGRFLPNDTLTRGEMALLIDRAFKLSSGQTAVAALMDKGIAQGLPSGDFGEKLTIKRADFAVFVARSINAGFRLTSSVEFDRTLYVNTGNETLNFRSGPNTKYNSLAALHHGQAVEYGYTVGDWAFIRVNGQTGFVHTAYLNIDQPDMSTPPPPPVPVPPTPPVKSPNDLVVIIDPGHGGSDPGAKGFGYLEKNIVLNISRKIKDNFDKTPITAKLTRTDDTFISLSNRVKFAQQNKGDIFISMHANAFNSSANGTETFYFRTTANNPYKTQSKALATYTQSRMVEAWGLRSRGVNPHNAKGNYHVLRENTMPAALAEIGFIDNKNDNSVMATEANRKKMADAIYLAALDYFYHYEGRDDVLPLYNVVNGKPSKRLH